MRLMRIGEAGRERPVVRVDDDHHVDVSDQFADFNEEFFGSGGIERVRALATERAAAGQVSAFGGERVGAPIARPHQIVCVGLNYADHARETGQPILAEPILFNKAPNTLIGPNDDVRLPRGSVKTDWEVELGVVIGRPAKYVSEADALNYVAGYCVVNDVSERHFQAHRSGQWTKGKSHDTFGPIGPWLVTKDEVPDPNNLKMWLEVDGRRFQDGSTATMVYKVPFLVSYLSQFMSLQPGDIISTGTPPGVGMGQKPPVYLKPGQTMRLAIEGLGEQRQRTVQA
jgi:2,4-didehydro-3-deoxy-L-rhamnonate hydrolase